MIQKRVYLDHNATTPVLAETVAQISTVVLDWGNPSSIHWAGRKTRTILREARAELGKFLGVNSLELILTSGGSESNSTIIRGFWETSKNSTRQEIISTRIEHPSILKALEYLQEHRHVTVHWLNVDNETGVDMKQYQELLTDKIGLVSVQTANNETGYVFPIKEMAELAHSAGALFHTDAVQALGKTNLNLKDLGVDYASLSGHKFYALKGSGLMFVKKASPFRQLIFGSQERQRRGGTENVLGFWSMGVSAKHGAGILEKLPMIQKLRDDFETQIVKEIENVKINQGHLPRLSNTSSLVIQDIDGETLLMSLDLEGFAVSTGAACSSGNPEPSPTLLALGLDRNEAQSSLRVSLGPKTTEEEIQEFIKALVKIVKRLRALKLAEAMENQNV